MDQWDAEKAYQLYHAITDPHLRALLEIVIYQQTGKANALENINPETIAQARETLEMWLEAFKRLEEKQQQK